MSPAATGRWDGVPELHSSVVQTLPSTGRSRLSLKIGALPAPSHCSPLQSPAVGSTSLVFAAVKLNPQTPAALQVRVRQAVSVPGQSAATAHPTHWPFALQWLAPPQLEFAGIIVCEGAPDVQMSLVHGLRSSGTSVSSLAFATVPSAAHWRRLQSPVFCTVSTVPAASRMLPQTPTVQVRCSHSDSLPAQSAATLHAAQVLSALHAYVQSALTRHGLPGPHFPQWPPQSMPVSSLFLMPSEQVGAPPSLPPASGPPSTPPPVPPVPATPPVPPIPPVPPVPLTPPVLLPPLPPLPRRR